MKPIKINNKTRPREAEEKENKMPTDTNPINNKTKPASAKPSTATSENGLLVVEETPIDVGSTNTVTKNASPPGDLLVLP